METCGLHGPVSAYWMLRKGICRVILRQCLCVEHTSGKPLKLPALDLFGPYSRAILPFSIELLPGRLSSGGLSRCDCCKARVWGAEKIRGLVDGGRARAVEPMYSAKSL